MLRAERQSAPLSKITNDGLTLSDIEGCFIAVPIKGLTSIYKAKSRTNPSWLVIDEVDKQLWEFSLSDGRRAHRRHLRKALGTSLAHAPDTVLTEEIELGQLHTCTPAIISVQQQTARPRYCPHRGNGTWAAAHMYTSNHLCRTLSLMWVDYQQHNHSCPVTFTLDNKGQKTNYKYRQYAN